MKKPFLSFLIVMVTMSPFLSAQTKEPAAGQNEAKNPAFGIRFSGYVNTSLFFDSRQTVIGRDGEWLYYPENIKRDAEGNDINARSTYNILSIQTRLSGTITGPDLGESVKSSGYIEGEFYGNINANINTFRLRHAYIRINWPKTELMAGQYWHPMFVTACSPETVSFNTGSPFVVFTRNPQIRLSQDIGKFRLLLTALSQVDVTSTGPDGPSPKYLRNSFIPEMNFQFQYNLVNKEKNREFLIGASFDYFTLTPRLGSDVIIKPAFDTVVNNIVVHHNVVTRSYKTTTKTTGLTTNFFARLKLAKVTFKLGGVYGGNCYAFNMIGGYAVKSVTDTLRGFVDYAVIRTGSVWAEFKTNGPVWSAGILAAYSKNFGAATEVAGPYYSRGADIDYVYRVAPRLVLMIKKLKIAAEVDYTVAAYGTTGKRGGVSDSREIGNVRLQVGAYYYF